MEEAYMNLYREFIQLRSLCLKQAALLNQLTETVRRLQAVNSSHKGATKDTVCEPNQCTQGAHKSTPEEPWVLPGLHQHPYSQHVNAPPASIQLDLLQVMGCGLKKLQLQDSEPADIRGAEIRKVATLGPLAPAGGRQVPPGGLTQLLQPDQYLRDGQNTGGQINHLGAVANHVAPREQKGPTLAQRPWMNSSFLNSELLSQAGGLLMSEVTLHSQVCEFCQAVFPGNTSTLGEFLRHLNTHIT